MKKSIFALTIIPLILGGCGNQPTINPTSVELNESAVTLNVGETKELSANVLPNDATNKTITWSVLNDSDCISVNSYGLVTALKVGSAIVEARTVNNITATCSFTILDNVVSPTSVSLDKTSLTIEAGNSQQLVATVLPSNATNKSVTWSVTTGSEFVSVSQTGVVNALKVGSATIEVKTVNNLTANCSVEVVKNTVLPTSITLNKSQLSLEIGGFEQLIATVSPGDASDKSVTWSMVTGNEVASVSNNGLVTAKKPGTATVEAKTCNGLTANCTINVSKKSIESSLTDKMSLVNENPYQQIDGDWVEVTNKRVIDNVIYYTFNYGSPVRFKLDSKGYIVPTGLSVNEKNYDCDKEGYVTFVATVEYPDDPLLFFIDIVVKYKDTTPSEGDYKFEVSETNNIHLTFYKEDKVSKILSCNNGDTCYVVPEILNKDYGVKEISGYTISQISTGSKSIIDFAKQDDGSYKFKCPFSCEESKTVFISVTEIDATKFKGHELVGSYAVVRTYGFSGGTYIHQFESEVTLTFDESGAITYKDCVAYASKAENGVIDATYTTSNINAYYGKNILILGMSSSGSNIITPLTQNSGDLIIAVKIIPGMLLKNIIMDNSVIKVEKVTHGTFNFYVNNELYASCYGQVDDSGDKKVTNLITDTNTVCYYGDSLSADKTVFEVFKENVSLAHIGYFSEGGVGQYVNITDFKNGYINDDHTLVFINNNEAMFDDELYTIKSKSENILLSIPTRNVTIALNDENMTFFIVNDEPIVPTELDIANKTFKGKAYNSWDEVYNDVSCTFGPSNTEITGIYTQKVYSNLFYWSFTGVFDSASSIITITVVDRGYDGKTVNFDSSIGREAHIFVENNTIKFLDNISTQTNVYTSKNVVLTLVD